MNWRDVRVGIVGLGSIGCSHAARLLEHGATVAGGMDTDAAARERFREIYGVDTHDGTEELFAAVDAVVVATPNCHHEEYAIAALDAGLSVLLEKPVAHSLESAERIADAARWSSGLCMVGFNNRFANSIEVLKTLQQTGKFGEVRHIEANYIRRRGVPGIGSWFTDHRTAGGGSLIDIGVHALDLALYVLDFPRVVEVTAATRSTFGSRGDYATIESWGTDDALAKYEVDDSVSAFVRIADGATVSLEVAWATNRPADDTLFVRGTDAGARFDRASDTLTLYESASEGVEHLTDTDILTRQNDTHAAEQAAFLEAVARGEPPERNTLEEGIAVQRVIDAIYRSSAAGRAIRLADPPRTKPNTAGHTVHWPETNGDEARTDDGRTDGPPHVRRFPQQAHDRQPETTEGPTDLGDKSESRAEGD